MLKSLLFSLSAVSVLTVLFSTTVLSSHTGNEINKSYLGKQVKTAQQGFDVGQRLQ